ncbi:hypothetical protein K3495_g2896 [Podosphaera aphanis]|nr:hypothetical protein K3495_g2896 [Podosphaera aphanis]
MARQRYKRILRSPLTEAEFIDARKDYRKTLKKAERDFYTEKIERASTGKDIFGISKWHKSTSSYFSPPLKDPRHPDKAPVTNFSEKREVLACNLLVNLSEADDINLNVPRQYGSWQRSNSDCNPSSRLALDNGARFLSIPWLPHSGVPSYMLATSHSYCDPEAQQSGPIVSPFLPSNCTPLSIREGP